MRARSSSRFCWKNWEAVFQLVRRTSPLVIWLFCGWHLTRRPRDLGTASAMNANGRNRKARKTAMAAPYGDWEPFSADPRMLGCVELRVVSSSWRFPPDLELWIGWGRFSVAK